ncbi:HNH endonuclease domain-containing protein [Klebsormidium nitens]|uniref:HNH endonuclease domain-containing protein n=1 Tax=Klebsormidium nitens TaxID=105231 RepID=A0A1Y1I5A5_KLENI|nr:HNH endonuclease domain-containing protein [Klebsormidium nitens]|eukprot:GAQ83886.1 HNH endonuclease domain-containing protein [Klebsormidium nitens]
MMKLETSFADHFVIWFAFAMAPEADGAADSGLGTIPVPSPEMADTPFLDGPRKGKKDRLFGNKMRDECWAQADVVTGRHPERWRKDVAGNVVCRKLLACMGCMCYEYDHIVPFSKGGRTEVTNCQILQTRANRQKSNTEDLGVHDIKQFSCSLPFSDRELDLVEMAVYGDVVRPGLQCRIRSFSEHAGLTPRRKENVPACELPHGARTEATVER